MNCFISKLGTTHPHDYQWVLVYLLYFLTVLCLFFLSSSPLSNSPPHAPLCRSRILKSCHYNFFIPLLVTLPLFKAVVTAYFCIPSTYASLCKSRNLLFKVLSFRNPFCGPIFVTCYYRAFWSLFCHTL